MYIESVHYDTTTEKIGGRYYCVYCGKQAIEEIEYDDYTPYYYHHCNCKQAVAEHEMKKEIKMIRKKYERELQVNKEVINDVKYQYELSELNGKYNRK